MLAVLGARDADGVVDNLHLVLTDTPTLIYAYAAGGVLCEQHMVSMCQIRKGE